MTLRWIDDDDQLDDLVAWLADGERYAMDTEFHRERTYFPKLALVQFAMDGDIALVDPLRCSMQRLQPLFASDSLAVLHAAQQDLDVLAHACGAVPSRMYDTQLAAGFLGYSNPSLVNLLYGELRVHAAKGDRLTDWLRRPLTEAQQTYAAEDVAHLLALTDCLDEQLGSAGRTDWVNEACEELRTRPMSGTDPESAWLRIKEVRSLRPKARGVARAVAAWRERRAMAIDSPVRQILPDLAVLGIAQKQPATAGELAQARGIDARHTRSPGVVAELLAAVEIGLESPAELPTPDSDELDRRLRPAVTLVSAWIADLAHKHKLDTALLATRHDLVALLRGDADARLAHGWRADLAGDGIARLVAGRAALAFDPHGSLQLVELD